MAKKANLLTHPQKTNLKPTLALFATFTLLLPLGITRSYAQREDTLKTFRMPSPLPTTTTPFQVIPDKKLGYPSQLGIDALEVPQQMEKEEEKTKIPPHLSIASYLKYFEKDLLKLEKDKYGKVMDLRNFVYQKGTQGLSSLLPRKGATLDQGYQEKIKAIKPWYVGDDPPSGITFWYPPSKEDIWFQENFAQYEHTFGLPFYIDTLGLNDEKMLRIRQAIDSVVMVKKLRETLYPDSTIMKLKIPRRKRAAY